MAPAPPWKAALVSLVPLAIFDPIPLYRRGLFTAFDNGRFAPEDPGDVEEWAAHDGRRILLVTTTVREDAEILRRFAEVNPKATVVALLGEPTVEMYVLAMRSAVSGAVSWMAQPETMVAVVEAAYDGHWLLPLEIATRMSGLVTLATEAPGVSGAEVEWLRLLAKGMTIAHLALRLGLSEREMFRQLRDLYGRMGARSRTEALVKAARWGLVK